MFEKPALVRVFIEGGVVTHVESNRPPHEVQVVVIDYDVTDGEATHVTRSAEGGLEPARVTCENLHPLTTKVFREET